MIKFYFKTYLDEENHKSVGAQMTLTDTRQILFTKFHSLFSETLCLLIFPFKFLFKEHNQIQYNNCFIGVQPSVTCCILHKKNLITIKLLVIFILEKFPLNEPSIVIIYPCSSQYFYLNKTVIYRKILCLYVSLITISNYHQHKVHNPLTT